VLSPGTKLGPCEIITLLDTGGMGEVYRAKDPKLGREVAIKILPPAFAEDSERLRRFESEARTTGSLNHPNILAVHDLGTHEGSPYLVMELLEGETLRARLGGKPRFARHRKRSSCAVIASPAQRESMR
jgi:serine/threonine protein kinase